MYYLVLKLNNKVIEFDEENTTIDYRDDFEVEVKHKDVVVKLDRGFLYMLLKGFIENSGLLDFENEFVKLYEEFEKYIEKYEKGEL